MTQGVLLIDKPVGWTSFDVVAKVRRVLGVKAIGHTGTLDPFATGVLVLLVGKYTRLNALLSQDDKVYEASIYFGIGKDSDDCDGEITIRQDAQDLTQDKVQEALQQFAGKHEQVPPAFSAIKVNGQRAYKAARQGNPLDLAPRSVEVFSIELVAWEAPIARVRIHCSKGTYIRAIARDLGKALGVAAHLSALRRLACGSYKITGAVELTQTIAKQTLADALQKGEKAMSHLSFLYLSEDEAQRLRQGRTIICRPENKSRNDQSLALFGDEPVAIVQKKEEVWKVLRGF